MRIIIVKMIIIAILLVTMSTGFVEAEKVHRNTRAPLSYMNQYRESEGPPVHPQDSHRPSRQDQSPTAPTHPQSEDNLTYKPFEMAPNHIKRLIYDAYRPQQPYVNPHAFFYKNYVGLPDDFLTADDHQNEKADEEEKAESIVSSTVSPIFYRTAFPPRSETIAKIHSRVSQKGEIKYKEDNYKQRQLFSPQQNYRTRDSLSSDRYSDQMKRSSDSESSDDSQDQKDDMPAAIQTLLQYQAQIPYNVLANQIVFETKKPFVPKPLPEDVKSSSQYPSKVFYIRADGQILEDVPAMGISGGEIRYKDAPISRS